MVASPFMLIGLRRPPSYGQWNEGSWRAAEACGYQREGLLRRWERVGDELKDMDVYSIIPSRS